MKRTINERKSLIRIFYFFPINLFSIAIFGFSIREPNIILGTICILGYFISLGILFYNFYSLGWEYKRISLKEKNK